MAQKVQTLFVDDLDGSHAEGTVRFALDGAHYEIDLNTAHAQKLRHALAPYAEAGRRVTGPARRPARKPGMAVMNGLNTMEIRGWAKANGLDVKERGRVPADLIAKFRAATGK